METSAQDSRTLSDQERVGLREIFQRFECSVCKAPSGGFVRFRICNKCKRFFRRTSMFNIRYKCASNEQCEVSFSSDTNCKSCHFKSCLDNGIISQRTRLMIQSFYHPTTSTHDLHTRAIATQLPPLLNEEKETELPKVIADDIFLNNVFPCSICSRTFRAICSDANNFITNLKCEDCKYNEMRQRFRNY